jgi:hypothetical protein
LSGNWESIVAVVVAILIAYAVVLWVGVIVWTYRDIRERTRDGWSQAVSVALVLVFNIPGLFLYLILRPRETLNEAYERRLEAEALMREMPDRSVCTRCDRPVEDDYLICPHCRTTLREPCLGCGRALELAWTACPYCGANGPQAASTAPPPPPAVEAAPPPPATDWPEPAPATAPSGQSPQ